MLNILTQLFYIKLYKIMLHTAFTVLLEINTLCAIICAIIADILENYSLRLLVAWSTNPVQTRCFTEQETLPTLIMFGPRKLTKESANQHISSCHIQRIHMDQSHQKFICKKKRTRTKK